VRERHLPAGSPFHPYDAASLWPSPGDETSIESSFDDDFRTNAAEAISAA